MNARQAIKLSIEMGEMVASSYLSDLTDADLMRRPHPGCNHINWQVGHLIASGRHHLETISPGSSPPLPAGFAEKYGKDNASNNDPAAFCKKDELLALHKAQQQKLVAILEGLSDAELDRSTGVDYAPTVGAMISLEGAHWLMHAGQWVIVRRELGKPALF